MNPRGWDRMTNDAAVVARLRARIDVGFAEIRALQRRPMQPRARTVVNMSKVDLEWATTRLATKPDTLELEYLGRWVEMVESQLRAVRAGTTVIGPYESPLEKTA